MKSNHLFEKYAEEVKGYKEEIDNLESKIEDTTKTIENLSSQYKEYIKAGNDNEADKTFNKISKLEDEKAKDIKRFETKKELFNSIKREKLIDLLLNRKSIPELYQDELQGLERELEDTIKQFNNVIDKINNMNEEYRKDMHKFDSLIDQYEMKKDDLFRQRYGEVIVLYLNNLLINTKSIQFNEHQKLEVEK
ncbi:TPA: hypothetical protein PDW96_000754 [Staphylococcus aureus]|uniref:Uncharacterized protein n=1 Tax=Staphylococcus chromogenes TaxID=46126 RepID=A0AAE5W7T2_STACR|nr:MULTISPECIES: hypothetical protein [Staphylococcus]HDE4337187.1 hypothetical protein [Staphylococcus aureus]MCQ9300839.1 hypothetical protein [Staphylococcus hyicus]PTG11493.1 hypothetical protein BU653_10960 [Staphylococcus chromogenes]HDE4711593.1 hypothetical protein [Staphylococcus aureus]HDE5142742.1 hypothetical protein [Staphylococcus aureus]